MHRSRSHADLDNHGTMPRVVDREVVTTTVATSGPIKKLKRFNILLDDESLLYFPGSFLTGKVLLELDENTPATGLYFHIIGEGVVRLPVKKSGATAARKSSSRRADAGSPNAAGKKAASSTTTISDRETYIDFRMRLLGDSAHDGNAGDYDDDDDDDDHLDGRLDHDNGRERDSDTLDDAGSTDDDSALSRTSSSSSDHPHGGNHGHGHGRRRARKARHAGSRSSRKHVLILAPGVHTFPFKLGLPLELPSTFLGEHGWVQYFCRAVLREPSGLVHKNQQVFIIINPIDLNTEPSNLLQPFYCEADERLASKRRKWFGGTSSTSTTMANGELISARVRLERGGYVPGENVDISASIENSSSYTIKSTRAALLETVEYCAKGDTIQSETRELAAVQRGRVEPKSTEVWRKEVLHIPALPPTNLRGCHLIKVNYEVCFEILVKHLKPSQKQENPIRLQLPIVMATYPVRNKDGTLKRRKGASYPNSLPILRPWMDSSQAMVGTLKREK